VTVYVPDAFTDGLDITEVKLFGPLQL
jgi:hypothetical protein